MRSASFRRYQAPVHRHKHGHTACALTARLTPSRAWTCRAIAPAHRASQPLSDAVDRMRLDSCASSAQGAPVMPARLPLSRPSELRQSRMPEYSQPMRGCVVRQSAAIPVRSQFLLARCVDLEAKLDQKRAQNVCLGHRWDSEHTGPSSGVQFITTHSLRCSDLLLPFNVYVV